MASAIAPGGKTQMTLCPNTLLYMHAVVPGLFLRFCGAQLPTTSLDGVTMLLVGLGKRGKSQGIIGQSMGNTIDG